MSVRLDRRQKLCILHGDVKRSFRILRARRRYDRRRAVGGVVRRGVRLDAQLSQTEPVRARRRSAGNELHGDVKLAAVRRHILKRFALKSFQR